MIDALYIGATGMHAQQMNVETISNNLANVNTIGYKKGRVGFSDLVTRDAGRVAQPTGAESEAGLFSPAQRLGVGVGISSMSKIFDLGDIKKTESAYDLAIQGDGFFEVSMPDGTRAFTRGGTFKVNKDGQLATEAGHVLKPGIAIPDNVQAMTITADGRVQVSVAGQSGSIEAGQLEMVRFTSPALLTAQGENLYRSNDNTGEPVAGRPGENGIGTLAQGFLEGSNVKLVEEMVSLMIAQRAYEASVKVVQASDEMLGMVNNLRR